MRPKGAKGGFPLAHKARWAPNHNWTHLSPILATITMTPKMAINHKRPQIGQGPQWTTFKPPEATRSAQLNPSPQRKGDSSHSSMHPVLKVAGVVHIWYYIPLSTTPTTWPCRSWVGSSIQDY
ncbi:hypothetical protein O181_078758 [Austropuccinia psidii MF-1]|uniref:Uncharacterized protein n=1 Tax=Austropuccinia psidii MF-1 TaxID=1389203 RepID=A0A9Q3FFE6_9BASI|nr:hypothetical protein [Austropuccinia psidii MF-1]